jgi:hypothetical protein
MRRRVITVVLVVVAAIGLTPSGASAEDLVQKLFGCDGVLPIACPGPDPW